MKSLGYDKEILIHNYKSKSYRYIEKFNTNLRNEIQYSSWLFSVAMLGMIEYMYITVSKNIHKYMSQFISSDI